MNDQINCLLHSRHASILTHLSLMTLLVLEFGFLLALPLWIAFLPCLVLHHRIGILLHEYMHGIPLTRYQHNLWVLSLVNGFLMTFGVMEVFRGNHLAHHRWLNTEKDPGFWRARSTGRQEAGGWWHTVRDIARGRHGPFMHLKLLYGSAKAHPYIKRRRVVAEIAVSSVALASWLAMDLPLVPLSVAALHLAVIPPAAFRGALSTRATIAIRCSRTNTRW